MPYEIPIGEVVSIIAVVLAQAVGLWKLLDGRFRRMEQALEDRVEERRDEMSKHTADEMRRHSEVSSEIGRLDRDMVSLRARVDSLPTRDQIGELLDKRVDKLEAKFDKLYSAMVRFVPVHGRGHDDDN